MNWDAPDEIDGWEDNPRGKSKAPSKKEGSPTPKPKPAASTAASNVPATASAAEREDAERKKLEAIHRFWDNAGPPDGHPYLERKGIPAQEAPYLRRTLDDYGEDILIVPGYDISGKLQSIERIPATEGKRKLHLGPKNGLLLRYQVG